MFQVRLVLLLIRWGFPGAQELRTPYPACPFFQEGSRWAVDLRPSTITPALRVYSHFLTSRPPDSSSKCLSKWVPSSCTLVRCPARTHLCSLRHFFVFFCWPSRHSNVSSLHGTDCCAFQAEAWSSLLDGSGPTPQGRINSAMCAGDAARCLPRGLPEMQSPVTS